MATRFVSGAAAPPLLGRLLMVFSPRRLAVLGLASSTLAYLLWGAATEGVSESVVTRGMTANGRDVESSRAPLFQSLRTRAAT